jgi:hypothetical protein
VGRFIFFCVDLRNRDPSKYRCTATFIIHTCRMVLTSLKPPTKETFFVCLSWDEIQTVYLFKQFSSFRMLQDYVDKAPRILKFRILSNVNKRIVLGLCSFEIQGMIAVTRSVFLPYAVFYQLDCCKHSRWKAEDNHWLPVSNVSNFIMFGNPQAASKVIIMNNAPTPSPETCMWWTFLYIVQRQLSSADIFSHQEVPLSHIAVTISTVY